MASVNKVILVGNAGRDPESRYGADGSAIVNLSLATTDNWRDKSTGEKKEATEWHRLVFFGKLAEIVGQYVKKGSQLYIEGRLRSRKWQDKDGSERQTTEVVVEEMKMLGIKPGESNGNSTYGHSRPAEPARQPSPAARKSFEDMDDDLPF